MTLFSAKRFRLLGSLLFFSVGFFANCGAAAELRCEPLLQQLRNDVSGGVFTADELRQVKEIYQSSSLRLAKKNQRAFAIYLKARLRSVPAATAAEIRELVAQRTYFNRFGRALPRPFADEYHNGFYDPDDGQKGHDSIAILLPPYLRHSLVHYMTLTHEIEHAIQWSVVRQLPRRHFWQQNPLKTLDYPTAEFLCESGAMLAEWSFGHAIPAKFRRHLAQRLLRDPREDVEANELSRRTLQSASLSGEAFLAKEWANGRYSQEAIADEAEANRWRPLDCWWYLLDLLRHTKKDGN